MNNDFQDMEKQSLETILAGRDVRWLLDQWAVREPNKPMLIWAPFDGEDQHWTYAEFQECVLAISQSLVSIGVKQRDSILIHMENCPEFLFAWFACAYVGAVAVTTNCRSSEREIKYFCDQAGVVGAFTQPEFSQLVKRSLTKSAFLVLTNCSNEKFEENENPLTTLRFDDLLDSPPWRNDRPTDPSINLSIQFTSGTTSRPKAVVWTHGNLIYAGQQGSRNYRLNNSDICQIYLPLFHMYGISQTFFSALWSGNTIVLQPKFSKNNFWRPALQYQSTWSAHIPFSLIALEDVPVPNHSFKFWSLGISHSNWEYHYRVKLIGSWGMTETVSPPIMTDPNHPSPTNSIGKPLPGYRISIRREDGEQCDLGETGRLYVHGQRGLNLFREYLNDPESTTECFDENGWLDTGDLVKTDEEGNIFFCDRSKDMLKVGGENVAASEIERVIIGVDYISECAVVPQKHYMLGEIPVAFVKIKSSFQENLESHLIDHCKKNLADFKVIRKVYIVDELPRSVNNKVAKNILRESLPVIEKPEI
jgi:carnitine-CoA ligase